MEHEIGSAITKVEGKVVLDNQSGLPDKEVKAALVSQYPQLISDADLATLDEWRTDTMGRASGRSAGIFAQNKYVAPVRIFDQFKAARRAARDDDIFSNAVETTEQLAFKKVEIESIGDSEYENSIWEQIKDDMKLEQKMRQIWRDLFVLSQCYVAVIWHRKDYKPKAKTEGGKESKKVFKNLLVPQRLIILDPCKVVPVGQFTERLVYIADPGEYVSIDNSLAGKNVVDPVIPEIIEGKFTPSEEERKLIADVTGVNSLTDRLYLLKDNVFRITASRADYERFADVRALSVFTWLDLKHNLQESDRADILGNLNAIILVRKGDKDIPATAGEISMAGAQVRQSARLPIIVSDHRLEIEIIQRKVDHTLKAERYNAIDSRITARLFQILQTGNYAAGTATDNSPGLFKIIASTMEARRDNIRDELMRNVIDQIFERNDQLKGEPVMKLRRVALDFDPHFAKYIFDLFALDQVSHATVLAEVDLDLEDEAVKKRKEKKLYGDIFEPPVAPGAPKPGESNGSTGNKGADGRIGGGNANGGGQNQQSFNSTPKTGTSTEK